MGGAKKTICVVCDGYWEQLQGGAEYQLYLLAQALQQRGYEVHYLYVERGTPIASTNVVLQPISLGPMLRRVFYPYQFLLYRKIHRRLDEIAPDLVINRVGNALTGICASYGLKRHTPTIWQIANVTDLLRWRNPGNRTIVSSYIDKQLLNYGIANSTYITAQARYQDALLRERFGRSADLILPNFHPDEREPITKSTPTMVVWIANVKPKKQPELFIRLANRFSRNPSLTFVMVGRKESERYQKKIERLIKGAPNLDYVGEKSIDEVNALLRRASVFVNTSIYEGFPNTFIQAWLRRVPVVSLAIDPDDLLKRRQLGFHSKTFEQLVDDVRTLVEDSRLRAEIGERAQQYARSRHGLEENVDRFVEFIEEA